MPRITLADNVISTRNIIDIEETNSFSDYSGLMLVENEENNNNNIVLLAGENLTAGHLGTIKDNLIYKATNLLADNKAPFGVINATVLSGASATLVVQGIINTSVTLTVNGKVYMRAGTPNLSPTILETISGTENLVIEIGKAITTNSFILDIKENILLF